MSTRVEMTCRHVLLLLLAVAVAVAACACHGASGDCSAAASADAAAAAAGKLSPAADVEEGTACVDGRQCAADLGDEWKGRSQTRREWSRKRDPTLEDRIRTKGEWFEMLAREMPHMQGKEEWGDVEVEAFDGEIFPGGALDDAGWEPVEEREWDAQYGKSDSTSAHSHADADADQAIAAAAAAAAAAGVAATARLSTAADVEEGAESGGARECAAAGEGKQQQGQDGPHSGGAHGSGDHSSTEQRRRSKQELLAELFGDEPEGDAEEEEEEWGDVEVEHLDSSPATEESATLSAQSYGGETGMEKGREEEDEEIEWDDAYDDEPFCSGCSNVWRPRDLKRMGL